jgi:ribosomal protein S18 acetylase RimI-like enzyme
MPLGMVRRAQTNDAQAIAVVHVTVSRETYASLLPAETLNAFSIERRAKQWQQTIETPNDPDDAAVFVAQDEGKRIVGFGCCSRQRSQEMAAKGFNGEFQAIYVLRSSQGRGLGRDLMNEMTRHLTTRSISGVSCWVLRENEHARRFYEALGGQIVGERVHELSAGTALVELAYGWRRLDSVTGE